MFLVTGWWEYIVVMSWEHWTAIEVEEREREKREQEERLCCEPSDLLRNARSLDYLKPVGCPT